MQEVKDQQTQGQGVTVESIETDDEDEVMEDNTNMMTGGLFHKSEDTNVSLTNPPKVLTTNLLITPLTGSNNLKRMQGGIDPVDNNKNIGGDANNIDQAEPKPYFCMDVQQKTVVFREVRSLSKGKMDKNTVYEGSKETIPINMVKRKD